MIARRSSLLQLVLVAAGAAACGGSTSDSGGSSGASGGGAAGASGTGGSAGSVGGGSGGSIPVAMLPAIPDGQAGLCTSEGTPGLTGPCCKRLTCFNAPSGKCPIPSIDSQMSIYQSSGCSGTGSGTCNCGFIEGPYAKGATEASCGAVDGECCYLVPIQSCTGRPLLVDTRTRVALLAHRTDWAGLRLLTSCASSQTFLLRQHAREAPQHQNGDTRHDQGNNVMVDAARCRRIHWFVALLLVNACSASPRAALAPAPAPPAAPAVVWTCRDAAGVTSQRPHAGFVLAGGVPAKGNELVDTRESLVECVRAAKDARQSLDGRIEFDLTFEKGTVTSTCVAPFGSVDPGLVDCVAAAVSRTVVARTSSRLLSSIEPRDVARIPFRAPPSEIPLSRRCIGDGADPPPEKPGETAGVNGGSRTAVWGDIESPLETVQTITPAVTQCYQAGLARLPMLSGRLTYDLVLAQDGRMSRLCTSGVGLDEPTRECIQGELGGLKFSRPHADGMARVKGTYRFSGSLAWPWKVTVTH